MKAPLYNIEGKTVGEIELSDAVFGQPWNGDLVHQIVVAQAANVRKPWAHAKGRGEVRGGGKKPWKQKHTGRARHGSIRSPIWKGGGVSHGPVKERLYTQSINKKMLRGALRTLLSERLRQGELRVVDALPVDISKTKLAAKTLRALSPQLHALLVAPTTNALLRRATANLSRIAVVAPTSLNVTDALRYKQIVVDQAALASLR